MRFTAPIGVLLLACAACASSTDDSRSEPVGISEQHIYKGQISGPEGNSAVLLRIGPEECGGTLIAPNIVATARHCVTRIVPGAVRCKGNGEAQDNGSGAGTFLENKAPETITVFVGELRATREATPAAVGKEIFSDKGLTSCSHDVAFVTLNTSIPNAAIAPVRLSHQAKADEVVSVHGWGRTDTAAETTERQQVSVPIKAVGPLYADPKATGQLGPRTFHTGAASCPGDSGSPALDANGALVGIAAYGISTGATPDQPCGTASAISVFMQVIAFQKPLRDAFDSIGAEPWLEGKPGPGFLALRDECGSDAECKTNLCAISDGASKGQCRASCSDGVACGEGYNCGPTDVRWACFEAPPPVPPPPPVEDGGCSTAPATRGWSGFPMILGGAAVLLAFGIRRRRRA